MKVFNYVPLTPVPLTPHSNEEGRQERDYGRMDREHRPIPEQVIEGYGGRKVAQRKMMIEGKEYLLRVVYEETTERITVVTAYLTSQITRYWKEGQ